MLPLRDKRQQYWRWRKTEIVYWSGGYFPQSLWRALMCCGWCCLLRWEHEMVPLEYDLAIGISNFTCRNLFYGNDEGYIQWLSTKIFLAMLFINSEKMNITYRTNNRALVNKVWCRKILMQCWDVQTTAEVYWYIKMFTIYLVKKEKVRL